MFYLVCVILMLFGQYENLLRLNQDTIPVSKKYSTNRYDNISLSTIILYDLT